MQQLLADCDDINAGAVDQVTRTTDLLEALGLRTIEEPDMEGNQCEVLNHLNTVWNGTTVLHTASSKGCSSLIPILLLYGANPAIKNQSGHTPYLVAKNKEVRDSFRRFMSRFPAAYDYEHSHVPSPLTEDMERERSKKEAEKRKEKKRVKKQREKVSGGNHGNEWLPWHWSMQERQCELTQQQTTATLSDREKRAMAAEKRLAMNSPHSSLVTQ